MDKTKMLQKILELFSQLPDSEDQPPVEGMPEGQGLEIEIGADKDEQVI